MASISIEEQVEFLEEKLSVLRNQGASGAARKAREKSFKKELNSLRRQIRQEKKAAGSGERAACDIISVQVVCSSSGAFCLDTGHMALMQGFNNFSELPLLCNLILVCHMDLACLAITFGQCHYFVTIWIWHALIQDSSFSPMPLLCNLTVMDLA